METASTEARFFQMTPGDSHPAELRIRRVQLDTGRENVIVISRRSKALRPEIFRGFSRVELRRGNKALLATLLITDDGLIGPDEIGLAEPAFRRFAEPMDSLVTVRPAPPPESLGAVRRKIQGQTLGDAEIEAIIGDITRYRYSDMEIAAFLVGSALAGVAVVCGSDVSARRLLLAGGGSGSRPTWSGAGS